MIERLMRKWCALTHGEPMLPRRGRYECRVCQRKFSCEFMGGGATTVLDLDKAPLLVYRELGE